MILILRLKLKASNYDLLPFKSFENFVIDRKIVFKKNICLKWMK